MLSLIIAYLLGGITLLPLILACLFLHATFVLPRNVPSSKEAVDAAPWSHDVDDSLREKLESSIQEPSVAASYFAVCREFVPGGVNGKPPERTTPAGETIAAESPSVYQSMYRSIFDRNKTQIPSMEAGKPTKKARNVFYVVLRHGHLLLFDNEHQLEVRHVIALGNYTIDIYAGGEDIPEGELFIKRNCIRLVRKIAHDSVRATAMPYYLFSDNCSDKEDFYHSLLHAITPDLEPTAEPPVVQHYETDDMIKLIRQLHVSDENLHSRWINALLGRIFLGLYKTAEMESFVRKKLTTKISRVQKPSFITSLRLHDISLGDSAPLFTSPKLREMNVDGGLTVEVDVKYSGSFRIVIAAVAKIDLGPRFKAREVSLLLAGVLKRLEGHLLVKIKPPPSNRLWMSFETMPRMDLSIEPIVSSRQITYGVILRAIESRIREVVGESLVLPNWDDTPFFDTSQRLFRGGVWETKPAKSDESTEELVTSDTQTTTDGTTALDATSDRFEGAVLNTNPDLPPVSPSRVGSTFHKADTDTKSVDEKALLESTAVLKPKVLRSNSFATAAQPIVSKAPSAVESSRPLSRSSRNAASAMKVLQQRSPESSPVGSPSNTKSKLDQRRNSRSDSVASILDESAQSANSTEDDECMLPFASDDLTAGVGHLTKSRESAKAADTAEHVASLPSAPADGHRRSVSSSSAASTMPGVKRANLNAQLNSATTAARNWSWGVIKQASAATSQSRAPRATQEPIGRGQPLPPPGMPLPRPQPDTYISSAMNTFRRKPLPPPRPPTLPAQPDTSTDEPSTESIVDSSSGAFLRPSDAKADPPLSSSGAASVKQPSPAPSIDVLKDSVNDTSMNASMSATDISSSLRLEAHQPLASDQDVPTGSAPVPSGM